MSTVSPAGNWGETTNKLNSLGSSESAQFLSVTQDNYGYKACKEEKEKQNNKYAKFKQLQKSGAAIINFPPSYSGLEGESSPSDKNRESKLNFRNTSSKLLRSTDAPIAVGRSGMRLEKGVATSGLIGERLMVSDDPKMNSFCQRSWLPTDDPALQIKKNGRPVSASNTQVTLLIGSNNSEAEFTGWNHGRKSVITGDVMTLARTAKPGSLFYDESP
eukprot:gene24812-33293_t